MINEILSDELLAIDAIFPQTIFKTEGSDSTYAIRISRSGEEKSIIELFLSFDHAYPIESPKVSSARGIEKLEVEQWLIGLSGNEVLFSLLSSLMEKVEAEGLHYDEPQREVTDEPIRWYTGDPVHDRKSVMLGRACRIGSQADLDAALKSIELDKELQKATHPRIWACRYRDDSDRLVKAHDDDGETAAGSRLAFLLDVTQREQVFVNVSRWYGGINLGPKRFHDILTAGRNALDQMAVND